MKKYFIITVDTEGEGGWSYRRGDEVHTICASYIPRFQELCEKYGFKPVYLVNYEMIMNDECANYLADKQKVEKCEIGIHVHAWNTPPYYELPQYECDQTFLIEYPKNIMREKFRNTYNLITEKMHRRPISHRAGRWVMNDDYFRMLEEFGIKIDCSYTPYINWNNTKGGSMSGPDYRRKPNKPHWIGDVLEVPMSIYIKRWNGFQKIKKILKTFLYGVPVWLRPAAASTKEMKRIVFKNKYFERKDCVEFMIHSSELMPSGSPYFPDDKSINDLYNSMDELFRYAVSLGYEGCTLQEYYDKFK